jgi:hypothetical protein
VQRLDARVDDNAIVGDAHGVAPAQGRGAAELQHLKAAAGLPVAPRVVERDHPIRHGLLAGVVRPAAVA